MDVLTSPDAWKNFFLCWGGGEMLVLQISLSQFGNWLWQSWGTIDYQYKIERKREKNIKVGTMLKVHNQIKNQLPFYPMKKKNLVSEESLCLITVVKF